ESQPRIRMLGTSLVQKDTLKFQLRNEIECAQPSDATAFHTDIDERVSFQVAKFLSQLVTHELKLPKETPKKEQPGVEQPGEPKKDEKINEANASQVTTKVQDKTVEFVLDLVLD